MIPDRFGPRVGRRSSFDGTPGLSVRRVVDPSSVEVEGADHREQDHQDEPDRNQHRENARKIEQEAGDR